MKHQPNARHDLRVRVALIAVSLSLLQACAVGGDIAGPTFEPCTNQGLRIQTSDCGGYLGCPPGNTKIPIDLGPSPAVARMTVGMIGQLSVGALGNNVPKGCMPAMPGATGNRAEWATSDPAVIKFTERPDQFGQPTFPLTIFVTALVPGTATVYARFLGERVDFAHCSDTDALNALETCVPVGRIVVTP